MPQGPRTHQEYTYLSDLSSCPLCYFAPLNSSSYRSIATGTIPIFQCFSHPNLPKHHRLGVLTLRDRTDGVQRQSQCWKKSLACAIRPRPRRVSVRQLYSLPTHFQNLNFLLCSFTAQACDSHSQTQECHHSGSRATSKLVFFEGPLGDSVGL